MRIAWPSTVFIDETQAPDWYLLAAVVIEDRALRELRDHTARQRLTTAKVHWWAESDARRRALVDHLCAMRLRHLVVVRRRRVGESDERCRRKCLETMLINLERMGVEQAVFEARERHQNDRDRHALEYLRRARVLRGSIRIDHRPGRVEPLLWLADILAGATRVQRDGGQQYDDMALLTEMIEI